MNDSPPEQWFQFAAWRFDIQGAERLLREKPRETIDISVPGWARAYGLVQRDPNSFPIISGPDLDPEYALTTDLEKPVILATLQAKGREPEPLLIDGCHRVYRANAEGRATLPAYVLTVAESLAIRSHVRHGRR